MVIPVDLASPYDAPHSALSHLPGVFNSKTTNAGPAEIPAVAGPSEAARSLARDFQKRLNPTGSFAQAIRTPDGSSKVMVHRNPHMDHTFITQAIGHGPYAVSVEFAEISRTAMALHPFAELLAQPTTVESAGDARGTLERNASHVGYFHPDYVAEGSQCCNESSMSVGLAVSLAQEGVTPGEAAAYVLMVYPHRQDVIEQLGSPSQLRRRRPESALAKVIGTLPPDQIRQLVPELWDHLLPNTTAAAQAAVLITMCRRRGLLGDLLEAVRQALEAAPVAGLTEVTVWRLKMNRVENDLVRATRREADGLRQAML
jgi:hypothetical protein